MLSRKSLLSSFVILQLCMGNLFAVDKVLATVGSENITKEDVDILLKGQNTTYDKLKDSDKQNVLNQLIERKILAITASKTDIVNSKIYKETLEKVKQDLALQLWMSNMAKDVVVNEASIKNYFNANKEKFKKPFDFDVLLARIECRLRFGGTSTIKIDLLAINPDEEKITYDGVEIELKGKPFEVLTHLARHRDQIVSKEQLLDAIWEEPELVTPNVIEVAINQIRQKMDKPLNISTIETIRRRGYRFCYPPKENELIED